MNTPLAAKYFHTEPAGLKPLDGETEWVSGVGAAFFEGFAGE